MKLHELAPAPGAKKKSKRVGRGPGSGRGKTAGRGQKGFLSRTGGGKGPAFEGGQMPVSRRLPKFGFTNPFRKEYAIVNVGTLARLETTETITPETLAAAGVVRKRQLIKILGEGEVSRPLVVQAHKVSKTAEEKIRAAGGRIEVLTGA